MFASAGEIVGIVAVAVVAGGAVGAWFMSRCIKIVQQGSVGVVKRFGEFRSVDQPGLTWGRLTVLWHYSAPPREEVVPTPPSGP